MSDNATLSRIDYHFADGMIVRFFPTTILVEKLKGKKITTAYAVQVIQGIETQEFEPKHEWLPSQVMARQFRKNVLSVKKDKT